VYIWAGAHAESLIEARTSEDPDIRITSPSVLLDQLAACITHPTFFREQWEEFYNTYTSKAKQNITVVDICHIIVTDIRHITVTEISIT
jgi:hypothetical protein